MLTRKRLKEVLNYDNKIGVFRRFNGGNGTKGVGALAGHVARDGRTRIMIDRKLHHAARLAWLYVYGYSPENDIDHIDRNPGNNSILNLREVSRSCNLRNTGNFANNTSGVKGVCWNKKDKRWRARIVVDSKIHHLASCASFGEAVCHRLAGEQCLEWAGCDSSSPAYIYVKKITQEGFMKK